MMAMSSCSTHAFSFPSHGHRVLCTDVWWRDPHYFSLAVESHWSRVGSKADGFISVQRRENGGEPQPALHGNLPWMQPQHYPTLQVSLSLSFSPLELLLNQYIALSKGKGQDKWKSEDIWGIGWRGWIFCRDSHYNYDGQLFFAMSVCHLFVVCLCPVLVSLLLCLKKYYSCYTQGWEIFSFQCDYWDNSYGLKLTFKCYLPLGQLIHKTISWPYS